LPQPVRLEMKYQRIPNLNASGTEVTIATLTLGNEGLETYPP
jgi:LmbE family N-acetylglucosaminyl deacetylase